MLGLKIDAPADGIVELVVVLFENFHRLGVGHTAEIGASHKVEALKQTLVNKAVEKLHFVGAGLKNVIYNVLYHGLGNFHVIFKVKEGHFRLDHPKFGGVAVGKACLGAEVGPKV